MERTAVIHTKSVVLTGDPFCFRALQGPIGPVWPKINPLYLLVCPLRRASDATELVIGLGLLYTPAASDRFTAYHEPHLTPRQTEMKGPSTLPLYPPIYIRTYCRRKILESTIYFQICFC